MLCQICQKRQATMHFTNIINNVKMHIHICDVCAKEYTQKGLSFSGDFSNFISGLMGLGILGNSTNPVKGPELICPGCNMTETEFLKYGKLGCEKCYTTFAARLDPLARRIHGTTKHSGKIPRRFAAKEDETVDVQKLKARLDEAVSKEAYEEAAKIRDRIKEIEGGMDNAGK